MNDVQEQIETMRRHVNHRNASAPDVSQWSVGMHIHHCTLSMRGIARFLTRSEGAAPAGGLSPSAAAVLDANAMPRGTAQAPERAWPADDIDGDGLEAALREAEAALGAAGTLRDDAWFEHQGLGVMRRDEALAFVRIHNAHHLAIIDDILAGHHGR